MVEESTSAEELVAPSADNQQQREEEKDEAVPEKEGMEGEAVAPEGEVEAVVAEVAAVDDAVNNETKMAEEHPSGSEGAAGYKRPRDEGDKEEGGDVKKDDDSRPRTKLSFDVCDMTHEQYCEKHWEIEIAKAGLPPISGATAGVPMWGGRGGGGRGGMMGGGGRGGGRGRGGWGSY